MVDLSSKNPLELDLWGDFLILIKSPSEHKKIASVSKPQNTFFTHHIPLFTINIKKLDFLFTLKNQVKRTPFIKYHPKPEREYWFRRAF